MTLSAADGRVVDLRKEAVDQVLELVEQRLGTALGRSGLVRKRRSVGASTGRGTWVRIERRPWTRAREQGWTGTETAAALTDVAMPRWLGSVAWRDAVDGAIWRADETELLPDSPVGTAVLAADPQLPDSWWQALNASLDALAAQPTSTVATPDTEPITQQLVDHTVRTAFPLAQNTRVISRRTAHADLNWANLTGPAFSVFDWEDWGTTPRGLDSASLLAASLAARSRRYSRRRPVHLQPDGGRQLPQERQVKVCSGERSSVVLGSVPRARHAAGEAVLDAVLALGAAGEGAVGAA
ncbi:hypothetical protein [Streptomyces sp. NRRL WC-3742]|uniref:hypothetical protein n=1 Tax=Streptomyces sp. NRRL WC-3742 TaxID=1463934 RepID=UPI0004CA32AC|nr:hypothetical protein [Streptomyces sp. NRRL WC-3742]